jgi:sporulation protein YlmC with PRC-barrel domain
MLNWSLEPGQFCGFGLGATVSGMSDQHDSEQVTSAIWLNVLCLGSSSAAFAASGGEHARPSFVAILLGAVLVSTPVLAQPSQPTAPAPQTSAGGWATQLQPDQWQASNLEGLRVYSSNNGDKVGDINELIFDNSGKVQAVVIGVGGYLGIGERDVAVPFDQIRFVNEPRVNTTGTTTGEARLAGTSPGGGTVASPSGTAAVPAGSNSPGPSTTAPNNTPAPGASGALGTGQAATTRSGSTPDHAVLLMSVTKDELRTAPEFRAPR